MPNLKKLLSKFNQEERELIISLIDKLVFRNWHGLDVKKLKGMTDFYRVRKGKIRIIYQARGGKVLILAIERRSETTYKDF